MKMNSVLAWLLLSMLLVLGGCSRTSYLESDTPEDDTEAAAEEEIEAEADNELPEDDGTLFVQVAGAVKSPGVYELAQGARVFEAIELAGGLKKNADDVNLNQASPLVDGEKIYVYQRGELEEVGGNADGADANTGAVSGTAGSLAGSIGSGVGAGGSGTSVDGRININTANLEDLKTLSGIGDVKAQAIISYREANGGFQSVDELTKVDGIGDTTLQKLRDYITI